MSPSKRDADRKKVRHSAKELTSLILDEERLRGERANRGSWKSRVTGLEDMGGMAGYAGGEGAATPRRRARTRPTNEEDDLEYRLALEASKNEAEADAMRRAGHTQPEPDDDDDLAKALKLSQEEEELRKRQLEDQNNTNLLFDDAPAQAPQPTGFNQGYQQQAAVDWFGNPVEQQQPQQTGFLNNAYSQPTGYQNNFGYNQSQQTGYDQMQQPQQQFLQPQNTYNPWAQQMNGNGLGQQQQQRPIQEQPTAQPGSNNPWATSNPMSTPMQAQPTGSNNPFATQQPQQQRTAQPSYANKAPTLSMLQEQQTANQFNQRPNPITNFQAPQPTASPAQSQPAAVPPPQDPYQARLNALLSSGEGQDTFGNVGDMRIPAQHTAPGTFVNSAGAGSMGRLEAAKTGNNPFFSQQQTAAQMQYPAQTGPVGFGGMQSQPFGGGNNPFGARPAQQQQQQQQGTQGGGSLIDF